MTDGELGKLPFEIFLTQQATPFRNYKELSYLINQYSISYNYSATLMKENLNKEDIHDNGKIFAFAATYPKVDSSLLSIRLPNEFNLRKTLISIPAGSEEVADLAENFHGKFLYGMAANERYFKENATGYSIIHLAMHGIQDSRHPILSSLAFTENREHHEDNFLQAHEISNLNLNSTMVVLSACQTGYGEFEQGEGIVSLGRSFMYAGVSSLVVSLWQINDASTSLIMKSFYKNLAEGMSKPKALQKAKLSYINSVDGIMAHPAFWSPFIQLGDSKPVYLRNKNFWQPYCLEGLGFMLILGFFGLRKSRLFI